MLEVDALSEDQGLEILHWWSRQEQSLQVVVCAAPDRGQAGHYRIADVVRHPARLDDRQRVAAAQAFFEADRLRLRGDRPAQRQAVTKYLEAVEMWDDLGENGFTVEALYHLGRIYHSGLQNRSKALEYYQQALLRLGDDGPPQLLGSLHHWIGLGYFQRGEMVRARDAYEAALPHRRRARDPRAEALTLNNLGLTHVKLGEPAAALPAYQRALDIWATIGNQVQEARTRHNRGQCYLELGNAELARHDFQQALAIRRELDDPSDFAATLNKLGLVHWRLGEIPRAIADLRQALELRIEAGNRRGQAVTLNSLGIALERSGELAEAADCHRQALAIFQELDDPREEATTLHNLAALLAKQNQHEEALELFRQALPLFHQFAPTDGLLAATQRGLARAERQRGRMLVALSYIEKATAGIEKIRFRAGSPSIQHTYFASKQSYYDFYIDLLTALHLEQPEEGYDVRAFAVSERARARALLDALLESGSSKPFDTSPELRDRELALEGEIRSQAIKRSDLVERGGDPRRISEVEDRMRDLIAEHDSVLQEIRLASPRLAVLIEPQMPTLESLQRDLLDTETILLEYRLGDDRSFLWAVTDRALYSYTLPPRRDIEELARETYHLVSQPGRRLVRIEQQLDALTRALLQPVAELLDGRRVLLVADGGLHYVPFAALPLPEGSPLHDRDDPSPPRLVDRHELVSLPSASVASALRQQASNRPSPPGLLAVFADPVFESADPRVQGSLPTTHQESARVRSVSEQAPGQFQRLIFSADEAEVVLAMVPESRRFEAIGFEASREAILSGAASDYRILHLATHGDINTEHPNLSRLVFSQVDSEGNPVDGFVYAHEIYDLDLPADLVVLSACQTALGREIRGEGLVGLTQGFLYAGAARVAVSLWKIDDRATAAFMASFYRRLFHDGLRPPEALRAAQMEIREVPEWRAPYFWAGFILQGDWR